MMWVGEAITHCEDTRIYRFARTLGSLRFAVATLDKYYGQVQQDSNIPALVCNESHPRFFPYPTTFEER